MIAKVTGKTIKSYIKDAFQYNGAKLKDGVILNKKNVEKVGKLNQNVIDYAVEKGVTIVDDLTGLF